MIKDIKEVYFDSMPQNLKKFPLVKSPPIRGNPFWLLLFCLAQLSIIG